MRSSLVMTIIPSIGNEYGQAGAWCWVQTTARAGKVLQFVTFYAPLWGAILFNGVTYFQVIRMLNNATRMAVVMSDRQRQVDVRADMKAMNRWGYYPLILIGSWTFATINRVHDFIKPQQKIFWLSLLDVGTAALMGLFNSIAYGLNASVRRTLQEKIDLYWPDRFRKWLPSFINMKDRSYENELIPLKVPDDQRNAV